MRGYGHWPHFGCSAHGLVTGRAGCARFAQRNERVRERNTMPKGYWVTIYRKINDPAKLAAYAELAPKATAPFGGKYLARGTAANAYEAGLKDRIVISEFPSVEKAQAAYESDGYKNALKALGDGAERDVRIVAGLD